MRRPWPRIPASAAIPTSYSDLLAAQSTEAEILENYPRLMGWDIVAAAERHRGSADRDIFEIVRRAGHVLLTFDKDFGDLYRELPLVTPSGPILFRFSRPASPDAPRRILDVLTSDFVWLGKFCVVEPDRIRVHSSRG